ncbi:efflux transporter, RND family, MFP subunit, related to HlyD [Desulfosarcina variabilis str. Montpellier]|uniref:efflux RND transporter periplasmic adaptor subunit n=1 Tax=Desulfosarcina variabilis TaxID=2300 RepID=UPI003AFB74A8
MTKHVPLLFGVVVWVILVACTATDDDAPSPPSQPRAVRTQTVVARDLPLVVKAVGRLLPNREVVVSAEVPGIVKHYDVDVGASVDQGALLAKIDPADYALALKEAEANLLAAQIKLPVEKRSFERARRLLPEKVITPELYDQAEASYQSAEALVVQLESIVAQARRRVKKTDIIAPFTAYVARRFVEKGQHIATGDPVIQLADLSAMRVKIHINELDYVHVDKNDPVTVTVEAFPGRSLTGRVDKIGVQADSRTNTFDVEILVDNPDFLLKAGLTARVTIQTDAITGALMIPQDTVLFREDRKEVFIVDDRQEAQARVVKLGRMDGSEVRVLEGLMPGQQLVVSGAAYLKPGDRVMVTQ